MSRNREKGPFSPLGPKLTIVKSPYLSIIIFQSYICKTELERLPKIVNQHLSSNLEEKMDLMSPYNFPFLLKVCPSLPVAMVAFGHLPAGVTILLYFLSMPGEKKGFKIKVCSGTCIQMLTRW